MTTASTLWIVTVVGPCFGGRLANLDALMTDGPMHTLLMQRHLAIERDFP